MLYKLSFCSILRQNNLGTLRTRLCTRMSHILHDLHRTSGGVKVWRGWIELHPHPHNSNTALVSHSIGDHKNVKTCWQCISLMEKTEFHFFSCPYFRVLPFAKCGDSRIAVLFVLRGQIFVSKGYHKRHNRTEYFRQKNKNKQNNPKQY